ncbi:MAG: AAA family ATPase [Balneolales bacterium]
METAQSHIKKMISFLSTSENLPDDAKEVEIRQTHGSILALTPMHVFKVKKPIDFGFMDFTTLEKRQANCHRELTLNRRLCKDTYLDVIPITQDESGSLHFGENRGEVIDYAVKMKRLEDGYFLKSLLKKEEDKLELIEIVGRKLIQFYQDPETPVAANDYGTLSHVRNDCQGNFQAMDKFPEHVVNPLLLETIKAFTFNFLARFEHLFIDRKQNGKILQCHGDLHLDHIHYKDGKLCIYDCVEFNEAYQSIDIANDLAFLAMDLEHNGYIREAAHFTTVMEEGLEDSDLSRLMHFYKVYRACVRGKVHGLAGLDTNLPESDRLNHLESARSFFNLALQNACCGPDPSVLIMFGPIGSGKSTLAGEAAKLFGCPHLNSDVLRKQLFNLPPDESSPDNLIEVMYSLQTTDQVYNLLIEKGLQYSRNHLTFIIDATFFNPDRRGEARLAFLASAVKPLFIFINAEDEIIQQRLADRDKGEKVISDARKQEFDKLVAEYPEPNFENYQNNLIEIDNSRELDDVIAELLNKLSIRSMELMTK